MSEYSVRVTGGKSGGPLVDSGCRKSILGFTNEPKGVSDPDGLNNSKEFLNPASSSSRFIVEGIADKSS